MRVGSLMCRVAGDGGGAEPSALSALEKPPESYTE
jgi:hypothetical protein